MNLAYRGIFSNTSEKGRSTCNFRNISTNLENCFSKFFFTKSLGKGTLLSFSFFLPLLFFLPHSFSQVWALEFLKEVYLNLFLIDVWPAAPFDSLNFSQLHLASC